MRSRTRSLVLGVNDRVALAQVRRLAQRAIHERHMRAGVLDPRPGGDRDRRRRGDRRGHRRSSRSRRFAARRTIGSGLHREAFLPRRLHARGRRLGRAVRLPPSRGDPAQGREGGDVRRDQELRHRPRREGPAPVLHRRRGRRRGDEPGREHDHRQLRRHEQAPHDDRQEGAKQCARLVCRAGHGRRRGVHGRGLDDRRGRPRRDARHRPRAPDQQRGLRAAARGRGEAR